MHPLGHEQYGVKGPTEVAKYRVHMLEVLEKAARKHCHKSAATVHPWLRARRGGGGGEGGANLR